LPVLMSGVLGGSTLPCVCDVMILRGTPNHDGEEQFKTIVRLTTSADNPEFKNSIITFMKINDKEWNRLLRNKQILYKKE